MATNYSLPINALPQLFLKPGREKSAARAHPWLFSGAFQDLSKVVPGDVYAIYSAEKHFVGAAYVNPNCSLSARFLATGEGAGSITLEALVQKRINAAAQLRAKLFESAATSAYRLVHGEADFLPGIVIDLYANVLVVASSTQGGDLLIPLIVDALRQEFPEVKTIWERSISGSRQEEKLPPVKKLLWGESCEEVEIVENGLRLLVSFAEGAQKTGLFLDQREARALVQRVSRDATVLNLCSFSGAFSLAAARGGATAIVSVDAAKQAIELARRNFALNGLSEAQSELVGADVFAYLEKEERLFDLVIADPPAFVKKRAAVAQALRGYMSLYELTFRRVREGGMALCCSCSHYLSQDDFLEAISRAAKRAGKEVQVLTFHHQAWDHPELPSFPEGHYLKSALLVVRKA